MRTLAFLLAVMGLGLAAFLPVAVGGPSDPRAGIERAKAAGMAIDPAAEEAMAAAPIGSCPNDPAQPKCPTAHAVVQVQPDANGFYLLERPNPTTAARTAAAVDALAPPLCALRGSLPYKAAGYAQADAHHECYSRIDRHELYASLYKYYSGSWYRMVSAADMAQQRRLETHPNYNCVKENVYRRWKHQYVAYTLVNDTWYAAGPFSPTDSFWCG